MRKIKLIHNYRNTPEDVWQIANNWEDLAKISNGFVTFHDLPKGKFETQIEYGFNVSNIFVEEKSLWHVEFLEIDQIEKSFKSREFGDKIEVWNHALKVIPHKNGAQLIEEIEIGASKNEFILYIMTKILYIRRHFGRLALLKGVKNG